MDYHNVDSIDPEWQHRATVHRAAGRLALRHPGEVLLAELIGPARAFVTRGILLGVKRRAEDLRP